MISEGRLDPFAHLRYFLKGRDKVVVTDDGQSVEHVDGLDKRWWETFTLAFL